jgi:metal-responsive CopG/Arc/MetJ family transcriptional regulator
MGKRAENKVHIGLYVDDKLRERLDELARVWGFSNRSQVILRLLSFGVGEMDRLTTRTQQPVGKPGAA